MTTEKATEVKTNKGNVIWARMYGFAPWPARISSSFERKNLAKQKPPKANDIAVTFIGTRNDSGWITESSVTPFVGETFDSKFVLKKFKSDKNYRAGVLEAVLLTKAKGQKYSSQITELLAEASKEFHDKTNHLCSACMGSLLSGELTSCLYCDTAEIHWHCFHPEDPTIDEGKFWVCDACCKLNKIPKGTILTREKLLEENKKIQEHNATIPSSNIEKEEDRQQLSHNSSKKKGGGRRSSHDPFETSNSTPKPSTSSASNFPLKVEPSSSSPKDDNRQDPTTTFLNKEDEDMDDQCFVCGLDGELLMCDFPNCPRVYHSVCIMKIAPKPLTIDTAYDGLEDLPNDDNVWFCPKHFCTTCGVLEASKLTSVTLNQPLLLPTPLYLHAKRLQSQDGYQLINPTTGKAKTLWETLNQNRSLKSCRNCPFSLCNECEHEYFPNVKVFKGKRGNSHYIQCQNCIQPNEEMRLAKLLESVWVKIASSRLALPFLRPLLPLVSQHNSPVCSTTSADLLLLIEHIHALKYDSLEEFERDLHSLQDVIYMSLYDQILSHIVDNTVEENVISSEAKTPTEIREFIRKHPLTKVFYDSVETIFEAGRSYIFSRNILFKEVEEELAEKRKNRMQVEQDETEELKRLLHERNEGNQNLQMNGFDHTKQEMEVVETVDEPKILEEQQLVGSENDNSKDELEKKEVNEREEENKTFRNESFSEEKALRKFWRLYCHQDPLHVPSQLSQSHPITDEMPFSPSILQRSRLTQLYYSNTKIPLITNRSLRAWEDFLKEGMMPNQYLANRLHNHGKLLNNQSILQIRNQLLLNQETAFSQGPPDTNEATKFNLFHDQCAKNLVKQILFFYEYDQIQQKHETNSKKYDVSERHRENESFIHEGQKKFSIEEVTESSKANKESEADEDDESPAMKRLKQEMQEGNQYLQAEYDAITSLLGMQQDGNNARENITLSSRFSDPFHAGTDSYPIQQTSSSKKLSPETAMGPILNPSVTATAYQQLYQDYQETPIFDESFVILNHLQSLTEQTLSLQMKLKQEYLRKQQNIFQFDHDVITFGELRLVQELKLANDNLRWRLEQKSIIIQKFKETSLQLKTRLQQSEARIQELELQVKKSNHTATSSTNGMILTKGKESHKNGEKDMMESELPSPMTSEGMDDSSTTVTGRGRKRKLHQQQGIGSVGGDSTTNQIGDDLK